MTKEELEKEADKYADDYATPDLDCSFRACMFEASKEAYLASAEPREKRIAELEDKLANADYQLEGRDVKIKELEAQIEKMKYALNKIIKIVHNDNISGYGDRLVIIYDISCEVLQEIK